MISLNFVRELGFVFFVYELTYYKMLSLLESHVSCVCLWTFVFVWHKRMHRVGIGDGNSEREFIYQLY